jgi:hypothetical protein
MTRRPAKRKNARRRPPPLSVRLPLPKKGEARHGDATKYARNREKQRLRKEIETPEGSV